MLRAPQEPPGRRHVRSAIDRYHLRPDRKSPCRQDPADDAGLWPVGFAGRHGIQVELPADGQLLDGRRHFAAAHWQGPGRHGQAQGQESHPRVPRQSVRQRAHPADAGTRQDARLRAADAACDCPWRRTEGHLAAGAPEPPRLRAAVGLGCDELHRPEGSPGDGLPTREDVWRVVGRCRTRCARRGRRCQGLPRTGAQWLGTAAQGDPGHPQERARQGSGHGSQGRSGLGAVHPWRDHPDAEHRSRAPRAGTLRQGQGHDRRTSALGHGKPGPRPEEAGRPGLQQRHAPHLHQLRRPHGFDLGPGANLGRKEVGRWCRLVPGGRADPQAHGQGWL